MSMLFSPALEYLSIILRTVGKITWSGDKLVLSAKQ
jgi:hypothetical protein